MSGRPKRAKKERQPELWERQDGESSAAFADFRTYRDMGHERSLSKVAQKVDKSREYLGRLSSRWNWVMRTDAWDDEMDRRTRKELAKGIVEMQKNHAQIARSLLTKALRGMQKIPDDELTASDVVRMIEAAAKLERMSRGEPTERTEGKQTIAGEVSLNLIDLSGVTDEELAALDAITSKISAG